ncbi:hypothetical protein [Novosphingobium sp. KN65.2]|uniref:hypothetical protein n=1 Tax=Novosphingobium sp. KN65.2 TaxID=1478134 RepID=UPI0012E2232B|nr:hypothetical protein [Novosphingobium sp. KN65.2]
MALPRGEILTSQPMAGILGVRWATLRDWCDEIDGFEQSGAFMRGSNGLKYEFCPVRTIWFLIEHFRALTETEIEKAERINAMALGADAQTMRGIDLDDMKKILDTQGRLMDMRERAGALVDAGTTRTVLNQVFSRMQEVALTAPQELDPSGQWPPEVRAIIDKAMQGVLLRQRAAARTVIEGLRQGTD